MNKRKIISTNKSAEPEFNLNGYFGKDVFDKARELFVYLSKPVFNHNTTGIKQRNLNR